MQSGYTTTYKEYWTLAWFLWVLEVLPCTLGLVTLCNMSAHRQWGGSPATTSDPSPYSPTSSGFDLLGIFWGNLYQQSGPGIWCLHDRILPELYWVRWIPLSRGHLGPSFGNMLTLFEMPQNLLPSHQSYNTLLIQCNFSCIWRLNLLSPFLDLLELLQLPFHYTQYLRYSSMLTVSTLRGSGPHIKVCWNYSPFEEFFKRWPLVLLLIRQWPA